MLYKCRGCNGPPRTEAWEGPCPYCGGFYSIIKPKNAGEKAVTADMALMLKEPPRISTRMKSVDIVLGGGLEVGTTILIGGGEGSGKSTLLFKIASLAASARKKVIYASGEQHSAKLLSLGNRIGAVNRHVHIIGIDSYGDKIYQVIATAKEMKPAFVIIDSLQTADMGLEGDVGTADQCKTAAMTIQETSQKTNIPFILISQLNSTDEIAGTRAIRHYVDGIFFLHPILDDEGKDLLCTPEASNGLRRLHSSKSRIGKDGILAYFKMTTKGLVAINRSSLLKNTTTDYEEIDDSVESSKLFLVKEEDEDGPEAA